METRQGPQGAGDEAGGVRRTHLQLERSTGAGKRLMPAAVALLIVVTASLAWADFKAGVEAYQRGDYATALTEFRLLAQQGNAAVYE